MKTLADKMAQHNGIDLTVSYATDRRAGLQDCDAVMTSFRPGGFEARYYDEAIPLMQGIITDMQEVCPRATLFNYTNPINLLSEAITHHSGIATVSLCEGPIIFPRGLPALLG